MKLLVSKKQERLVPIAVALYAILFFFGGILAERYVINKPANDNLYHLSEALEIINDHYIEQAFTPEELRRVYHSIIETVIKKRLDRHSHFLKAEEIKECLKGTWDKKTTPPDEALKLVEWKTINNIGYLKIMLFIRFEIYQEIEQALEAFNKEGVQGLIIDLRNNIGGDFQTALEISDFFLEKDKVITITLMRQESSFIETSYKAKKKVKFSKPIVILVNENTASGSEIFTSALKYHKKARIIGIPTYGKTTGQQPFAFEDGSLLTLTTLIWLTPANESIPVVGIIPDIFIRNPNLQLQKAIEILKNSPATRD